MIRETLARNVKKQREIKGWSQGELAKRVGVSRQMVERWENAKSQIEPERIEQLAEIFEVDYLSLYRADASAGYRLIAEDRLTYLEGLEKALFARAAGGSVGPLTFYEPHGFGSFRDLDELHIPPARAIA